MLKVILRHIYYSLRSQSEHRVSLRSKIRTYKALQRVRNFDFDQEDE